MAFRRVKGKFGWDFVNSEKRLTKPLIREGDSFREAEWDEAPQLIADKFTDIKNISARTHLPLSHLPNARMKNHT